MNRICLATVLVAAASASAGQDVPKPEASRPGEVAPELPTLRCLAVRWPILGDANRNAAVEVGYRKAGETKWRRGYPLLRCLPDPHPGNRTPLVRVRGGWMFAGSIVDLRPQTAYEVRLRLTDPDGGGAERTLKMATIGEPAAPDRMRVLHVVPGAGGGTGSRADPLRGLDAAGAAARPGDLFLLHKGTYVKGRCRDNCWRLDKSGRPGKPIIFRAAGDGEAVLDGDWRNLPAAQRRTEPQERLVSADRTRHVWFEDLTLRGKPYLIVAHRGSHWVVRRCRLDCSLGKGFESHNGGYRQSRHHFLSDNVFAGPASWPRTKGIESFAGIQITGAGHTVCHNWFHHLGDGVHGQANAELSACDFHNNEVHVCTDDGIETDFCDLNVRVFDNRIVNTAHGITFQPARGGPVYAYRNVIYNATYTHFKLHNHTTGVLLFHNTCMRKGAAFQIQNAGEVIQNTHSRNNLFLGTGGDGLHSVGRMRECSFDNDGYGGWTRAFVGRWNGRSWRTIAEARKAGEVYAGHGAHKVDPRTLCASGLLPPDNPATAYRNDRIDARLKAGSDAVDKGVYLPNFSDGFQGQAADLGAFELGDDLPHYGPRPRRKGGN